MCESTRFSDYGSSKSRDFAGFLPVAQQRAANGKLVGAISGVLFGMPIIKAWQSEPFEAEYFHRSSHAIFDLTEQNQKAFDIYWGITCLLKAIGDSSYKAIISGIQRTMPCVETKCGRPHPSVLLSLMSKMHCTPTLPADRFYKIRLYISS